LRLPLRERLARVGSAGRAGVWHGRGYWRGFYRRDRRGVRRLGRGRRGPQRCRGSLATLGRWVGRRHRRLSAL